MGKKLRVDGHSKVDMERELKQLVNEYKEENYQATQFALNDAAEVAKKSVSSNSPRGNSTASFANHWMVNSQYPNLSYVYNAKFTDNRIPLSNLLEYASNSPHQGYIFRTYNQSATEIYRTFVNSFKKNLK